MAQQAAMEIWNATAQAVAACLLSAWRKAIARTIVSE